MKKAASLASSSLNKLQNVDARGGTVNITGSQTIFYVFQNSGAPFAFDCLHNTDMQ